jgi:hypothetical protein
MPCSASWAASARTAPIMAGTVHTVLRRAPGRDGCGVRVQTTPAALATSIAATFSKIRSCSWSSINCGVFTAASLCLGPMGNQRAARGPRSGQQPESRPSRSKQQQATLRSRPQRQANQRARIPRFASVTGSPPPSSPPHAPSKRRISRPGHHAAATPATARPHRRQIFTQRGLPHRDEEANPKTPARPTKYPAWSSSGPPTCDKPSAQTHRPRQH